MKKKINKKEKINHLNNKIEYLLTKYIKETKTEIKIKHKNNHIEITFIKIPTTKNISKLIYMTKSIKYKFKQKSLISYTITPIN